MAIVLGLSGCSTKGVGVALPTPGRERSWRQFSALLSLEAGPGRPLRRCGDGNSSDSRPTRREVLDSDSAGLRGIAHP